MKKVLVTGGTGFLGRHLVELLLRRGEQVRVLTRAAVAPELDGLDVETIEGSVLKPEVVARAVKDCGVVYHCAGLVSRDPDALTRMMRLHVEGTRNVLQAAEAAKVARVVVVSTSGTIAVSKDPEELSTEASPYRYELVREWPYYLSKIYEEKQALFEAASMKTDVVIVNPSLLLGPGDSRLSSTGDVLKFLKREIPVTPSGGLNFVDARDAAAGCILAAEKGKRGERYLLGGPNWEFSEFFSRLARVSDVRAPAASIPDGAARFSARLVEFLHKARKADGLPPVDPIGVQMSQHYWFLEAAKARAELGWEPRDPMETLDDTVAWLREKHLGGDPPAEKAPSFLETLVTTLGEKPAKAKAEKPLAKAKKQAAPKKKASRATARR